MPEAPAYLVNWLAELGWCESNTNGFVGLSAVEIIAWAKGRKKELEGWEFEALLNASRQYVSGYYSDEGQGDEKVVSFSQFAKKAGKAN